MSRRRSSRGYVLLLVLLLLVLAGFSMAGLARASLRQSMAARDAQEELQRRWGFASVTSAVLPRAMDLMDATPPRTQRPIILTLGGQRFDALLCDEQAKVNVNALSYWYGASRARGLLDAALDRFSDRLKADLRAMTPPVKNATDASVDEQEDDDGGGDRMTPTIASLGQLFTTNDPLVLRPTGTRASPTDLFTCWGNGLLNVQTASRAALIEATHSLLTAQQIDQLIAVRAAQPKLTLEQLLPRIGEQNARLSPLLRRLTDESWCYALWISAESRGRRYDRVAVRDEAPVRPTRWTFDWTP